ncbi:MAG: HD domain-containing protein [Janthinobacterium lividum]
MLSKINLPAFLEDRLHDATHEPAVSKALQEFGKWFAESKQTFFPDYTNHGIQHIEQVLDTVANLIPKGAEASFTKDDAAALILAVLLHDSALHLSKAGFKNLIKGTNQYAPLPFFDRADWEQTWMDFMFLARRWDDVMLANVFGQDEDGAPRAQVRDPFDHWSNLSETDELLIGEFIRKHHPRIAHEMAMYGVPGKSDTYLTLNDLPLPWRDLVGLIARSHGLPLRTGLDYLKKTPHFGTYAHREYRNVHAVYLMALLRVGDYIQIQGDRTSERVFEYKDIRSLVSQVEHKVHLSDIIITDKTDDPESLQIDARPLEVAVFLRLKDWLAGIQQELDSSWAVLGEVYGLQPKLRNLGLTFRRVRSNLDDVAEFAKTVPYVPDRIRFDVARAELLKLLIGPLYGDDPSYGVRELMQNSVDAVREYDQFVLDNPHYKDVPRRKQEADVVIELGPINRINGYALMTVSDRGIGMTEEIIRDYFLRAGASYRQHVQWKAWFESDAASKVKSKVLRSGRFGVGALAAFLIGEEIEVETRHINAKNGFLFKTQLSDEAIDVKRSSDIKVGTQIRINVNPVIYSVLSQDRGNQPINWDWYCGVYPTVVRKILQNSVDKLINAYKFSQDYSNINWREIPLNLPYKAYWTYDSAPALMCNNIFINDNVLKIPRDLIGYTNDLRDRDNSTIDISYPRVAVLDPDGLFPLNLQRTGLRITEYAFSSSLINDIFSESLAWLFFNGPDKPGKAISEIFELRSDIITLMHKGLISCSSGYGLTIKALFDMFPVTNILINLGNKTLTNIPLVDYLIFSSSINHSSQMIFGTISISSNHIGRRQISYHERPTYSVGSQGPSSEEFIVESHKDDWLIEISKKCPATAFEVINFPEEVVKSYNRLLLEERFYSDDTYVRVHSNPWFIDKLWQKYFGKNWIPFALRDRIAKFSEAAKFFKERYPQVVPDEAWALLGGKPEKGK